MFGLFCYSCLASLVANKIFKTIFMKKIVSRGFVIKDTSDIVDEVFCILPFLNILYSLIRGYQLMVKSDKTIDKLYKHNALNRIPEEDFNSYNDNPSFNKVLELHKKYQKENNLSIINKSIKKINSTTNQEQLNKDLDNSNYELKILENREIDDETQEFLSIYLLRLKRKISNSKSKEESLIYLKQAKEMLAQINIESEIITEENKYEKKLK